MSWGWGRCWGHGAGSGIPSAEGGSGASDLAQLRAEGSLWLLLGLLDLDAVLLELSVDTSVVSSELLGASARVVSGSLHNRLVALADDVSWASLGGSPQGTVGSDGHSLSWSPSVVSSASTSSGLESSSSARVTSTSHLSASVLASTTATSTSATSASASLASLGGGGSLSHAVFAGSWWADATGLGWAGLVP